MRRAFIEAIDKVFETHDNAVLLIGDIGSYMLRNISEKHPGRIINAGISEANMLSVAAGLALEGFIPFVYTITPFITSRCYDQIRVGAGYNGGNVKIIGVGSGISYSALGATHHSIEDIAILNAIPNMTIISPADGVETKEAIQSAATYNGAVYLRLMLNVEELKLENRESFSIGKAQILKPGRDTFLIATGQLVNEAMKAAELLSKENISVGVVNMSTLKPIDVDTILALATTAEHFFSIEEHNHTTGLGSLLANVIVQNGLNVRLTTLGLPDKYLTEYGHKEELYRDLGIDAQGIAATVKKKISEPIQNSKNRMILPTLKPSTPKIAKEIIDDDLKDIVANIMNYLPDIEGKTFLITGPNGLLASYLVDTLAYINEQKLLDKPCRVIGLQRSIINKNSRLGHLLDREDIKFYEHDVKTPFNINEKIDYIIHAAGRSAPATFQSDPLGTIDVNVMGIRWLLDYAKDNKVTSLLYMSSGEIYGNPTFDNIPTKETYNGNVSTLAPRACYTESKRLAETLCSIYANKYSVPAKIARPFIVYGPGLSIDDRRVMADFIRSGLNKKPIKMLSEGSDLRSYCYITDASILFFRLLFSNFNANPFNIANGSEEISIRDLAEMVHEICEIEAPVEVAKFENTNFIKDAPNRVCPGMSKAKELLDYSPVIPLKKGLRRTIEWNRAITKLQ